MKKKVIFNISYAGFFEPEVFSMFSSPDYHVYGAWDATIARDIVFSKVVNKKPLVSFLNQNKDLICFSSLFGSELKFGTDFQAYLNFDFLFDEYPDAVFILIDPSEEIWRTHFNDPDNSEFLYTARNVYLRDGEGLIDFLLTQKRIYIDTVKRFFKDSKNFLLISDFNNEIDFYKSYLNVFFGIDVCNTKIFNKSIDENKNINISKHPRISSSDIDIFSKMVDFCSADYKESNKDFSACSDISACYSTASGLVSTLDGSPQQNVLKTRDGKFISNPDYEHVDWKFQRVAAVLNNVTRYVSDDFLLRLDMQDNRLVGASDEMDIGDVVYGYCRRQGARNIALVPLPGFHDIGGSGFVGGLPSDQISFGEKVNKIVWRGALSGFCNGIGHENIVDDYKSPTHVVLNDLTRLLHNDEFSNVDFIIDCLKKNVRYSFVSENFNNPYIDAAFVLEDELIERLNGFDPIGSFAGSRQSAQWIWKHKYIACLRGFDTASNFIMALASNSVAMKEEDGWEVYYSFLFKPWVHYIPLAAGATDILEKYEWAENNPDACQEMIINSNKMVDYLGRHDIRNWYLSNLIGNF